MAQQGATLQNYNNELVKCTFANDYPCIEDLREKREEVNRQILKEEEEKAKIQKDLSILTDRLSKINESLARKVQARNEYDKTIQETEAAYMKILESSQTLLHVLKRETVNLTKKKQSSS
eukprot:g2085.t1